MAILAIIAFQGYWMYKNYQEEEKTLQIRTSAVFRNVAYRLQAAALKQDTSIHVWATARRAMPMDVRRMPPPILTRGRIEDTSTKGVSLDSVQPGRISTVFVQKGIKSMNRLPPHDSTISITVQSDNNATFKTGESLKGKLNTITIKNSGPMRTAAVSKAEKGTVRLSMNDTAREYIVLSRLMEDGSFRNLFQRVDSLYDTLSLKELDSRFRTTLKEESLNVGFSITRDSVSQWGEGESFDPTLSNELLMGYADNYFLRYELQDTFQYITRKLSPQIGLSLLLIALTSFSFVLLYRNLVKQRRLTQFKNDLISNITHELKTPIATVSVAIEALKNFHAMDDPRRTEEYLDISNSELQRLSLLVDKVLRLSMFEKHQVELRTERFDLRQLAADVMFSMRLQFEKSKANVQLQAEGDDLTIDGDKSHITSVIFNLLDNALKYSGDKPDITVTIIRNPEGLQLTVSDNGFGIPAAYRKKVFDKFFRVPSGDTHNVKGHGLGLSYVAYVVERHKGTIELVSEPGEGSSFIIQLPDHV